jgi:hypothetical protein
MLVGAEAQHMFELAQADLAKRVERLLVVARTIVTNAESNLTAAKSLTQVFGPLYALGLKRELTGAQERLEFLEDLAGRNTRPEACVLDPSSLEHDEWWTEEVTMRKTITVGSPADTNDTVNLSEQPTIPTPIEVTRWEARLPPGSTAARAAWEAYLAAQALSDEAQRLSLAKGTRKKRYDASVSTFATYTAAVRAAEDQMPQWTAATN